MRTQKHTACMMSHRTGACLLFHACLSVTLIQVYMMKAIFLTSRGPRASSQFSLCACDVFRWSKAKPEGDPLLARLPLVVCEAAHHEGNGQKQKKAATPERKQYMVLLNANVDIFCFWNHVFLQERPNAVKMRQNAICSDGTLCSRIDDFFCFWMFLFFPCPLTLCHSHLCLLSIYCRSVWPST